MPKTGQLRQWKVAGALVVLAALLGAQEKPDKSRRNKPGEDANGSVTITGCLIQGTEDSIYFIKTADGKNFAVTTSMINLKPHVGHTLEVRGVAESADLDKSGNDPALLMGKLDITELKVVKTSCQ